MDLTFFEYPGAARGRAGAGMVHRIVWRVSSEETLGFWQERLAAYGTESRLTVGSLLFSAQYQQRPVPLEGNLILRAWFKTYEALPPPSYRSKTVQSWDIATATGAKNDYSICTTWRIEKNDVYLMDVYRGRLEYPHLRRKVIALAKDHSPATILIEEAGPGMNLLQDLRLATPVGMTRPIGVKPEGSKVDRMAAQSAKIEAGHVHFPRSAHWLADFLQELLSFPNGRYDDQVDSVSQFLLWHQKDARRVTFFPPAYAPTRPRNFPG